MTVEVAIMNTEAVAMAADSAVTVRNQMTQKVFTSANKIFALSKQQPVGIMFYGSSQFMMVPWESVIELYRERLGRREFDRLRNYADDFVGFLERNRNLFPAAAQKQYVAGSLVGYFESQIKQEIEKEVEDVISAQQKITDAQVKRVISEVVKRHYDLWQQAPLCQSLPRRHVAELRRKYRRIIAAAKRRVFQKLPLTRAASRQLTEVGASLFAKFPEEVLWSGEAGVVVAGFGKKDVFPCLRSFRIEGIAANRIKYEISHDDKISRESAAAIYPFAQGGFIFRFMEGVDPGYQSAIERDMLQMLQGFAGVVLSAIPQVSERAKKGLENKLNRACQQHLDGYTKKLRHYRRDNFWAPIVHVVRALPKNELAAMAEALISLTSHAQRVSMEAETVGGPIDVAVISRGDGFIWVKRKQYFSLDLNPGLLE